MTRTGLAAGLICLAALPAPRPAVAAEDAACVMLGAALEAGAYPAALDPEGGARAAAASGDVRECTYFVGKATVHGVDLLDAAALRDPAVCEHLVGIALADVLRADWQERYGGIVARVADGDLATCGTFFRDYGQAVLDGRGPACTRAGLAAEAGMLDGFGTGLEAARGGDEAVCAAVLETHMAAPPDLAEDPPSGDPVPTGMCAMIRAGVEAGAFRPSWPETAADMRSLAEAGDEHACRELLAAYGRAAPDGELGPYCARADLTRAAGLSARPDLLAAAVEVGAEVGCREVVRMHAAER